MQIKSPSRLAFAAMSKPQPRKQSAVAPQGDHLTIRFGNSKPSVDPDLQDLRNRMAAKLGVNTQGKPVDLPTLRKAFVTEYYTDLAKTLTDDEIERNHFYDNIPDINKSEDDFFFNMLDSDKDVELYELHDSYVGLLGYEDGKDFQKGTAPYRKQVSNKLGLNTTSDRKIIDKMASLDAAELTRRFAL